MNIRVLVVEVDLGVHTGVEEPVGWGVGGIAVAVCNLQLSLVSMLLVNVHLVARMALRLLGLSL